MSGLTVHKEESSYEEAEYKLNFETDNGIRAHVHVEILNNADSAVKICSQGNTLYGIASFLVYINFRYKEPPKIVDVVSGDYFTYQM